MQQIDGDLLRPVSVLEYNARNFGLVVSRNKIRGKLSLPKLHDALTVMMQRHPFLRAVFHKSAGRYYFRQKKDYPIPLSVREGVKTDEERRRLYEDELNVTFNYYEQMWRVLIVLDCSKDEINEDSHIEMILTFQHVICDGLSILNLAKEILEQTQALQEGRTLYENLPLMVIPPMDQYLPDIIQRPKPFHMARSRVTSMDHSPLDTHHLPQVQDVAEEGELDYSTIDVLERDLTIPKSECRIRHFDGSYSVPELRSLSDHCKYLNISIHGVLSACIIKAISECVPAPSGRPVNLLLRNPVNRRVQAAPDSGGIGNQYLMNFVISELIHCTVEKTTTVIDLAQQFMKKLDYEIESHQALRRYQAVVDSKAQESRINQEKDAQIMTISNVGLIDTPEDYGDFKLLSTNFISSNKLNVLQFSTTAFAGRLHYLLLHTSPCYDTALIQVLHHRFREHMQHYI
jgi:hypothetical protein